MNNTDLMQRITVNPNICHGKPTVRGLRYPVVNVLEMLASDMTQKEILADYPDLEKEDLQACLLYAQQMRKRKWSGGLSDETADKMLAYVEKSRQEWEERTQNFDFAREGKVPEELTDAHKAILDERWADYIANPDSALDWEDVKNELITKYKPA